MSYHLSEYLNNLRHQTRYLLWSSVIQSVLINGLPLFQRLMPPTQRRMYTIYQTRADRIFVRHLPSPPCWPNPAAFSVDRAPLALEWKEYEQFKHRLNKMMPDFQRRIIYNRKRVIQWYNGHLPKNTSLRVSIDFWMPDLFAQLLRLFLSAPHPASISSTSCSLYRNFSIDLASKIGWKRL